MKKLLLAFLVIFSFSVWADENDHPMARIIGDEIDLHTHGHSFAGKVGDKLIFGDVSTNDGHQNSTLTMKQGHGVVTTNFTYDGQNRGGVVNHDGKVFQVEFVELQKDIPAYVVSFGGKKYTIRVEAEDFRNNHFIRPRYILELDGKEISAKMTEGQACYMFSMHIIFMVFGSYLF